MDKILSILMLLSLVGFNITNAQADVFGYADESGAIYLTDTPSDEQYQLLLTSPEEPSKVALSTGAEQNISEDSSSTSNRSGVYAILKKLKLPQKLVVSKLLCYMQ